MFKNVKKKINTIKEQIKYLNREIEIIYKYPNRYSNIEKHK